MTQTLTGLFDSYDDAQRAVKDLEDFRRVATRYDNLAANLLSASHSPPLSHSAL